MGNFNITIGSDPELFLEKDGEIISAENKIGGSKDEPLLITRAGHALQEDNVMVEYNIPPASSRKDFVDSHNLVKKYLADKFSKQGIKLNISSSANLAKKYLRTKQAKKFGCEPDYNVWSRSENNAPSSTGTLRTCGGHIHVGIPLLYRQVSASIALVKLLDATLGILSVILDPDKDRRTMYGKAGCVRFKPYGFEYRSLSNFWIKSDDLMKTVYDITYEVTHKYLTNNEDAVLLDLVSEKNDIETIINTSDVKAAKKFIKEHDFFAKHNIQL